MFVSMRTLLLSWGRLTKGSFSLPLSTPGSGIVLGDALLADSDQCTGSSPQLIVTEASLHAP